MQGLQTASDKHVTQRRSILEKLLRALFGLWADFDRWDDEDVVAGMAARSATLVNSAVAEVRRTQRSYLGSVLNGFGIDTSQLPSVIESYPRANTFTSQVYSRPVEQFIWARRNGGTLAESREAFEQRLREIAQADMLVAEREESQRVYAASPRVIGHRRIIHPEKSESGFSCGLCVVAATRIYSTSELQAIHGGCNCDSAPVTAESDPGLSLNENDLKEFYNAAGSTAAEDLINTRVRYVEHGELGPILVKQGDHFRTPEEAGRPKWEPSTPESRRAATLAELDDLTAKIASAQQRYDDMVATRPETLTPNSPLSDERVALFRSLNYMRELAAALNVRLTRE
jgi:hypothetical protein